jgi:hypothetical protein
MLYQRFALNFVAKFRLSDILINNKASIYRAINEYYNASCKTFHRFVKNLHRILPPKAVSHFQFTAI